MTNQSSGMSLKLRLVLGFVVLGALALSYRAVTLLGFRLPSDGQLTAAIARQGAQTVTLPATSADSDFDGLIDSRESQYDTDPFKADSDGDGYLDGEEVLSGFNPSEKDTKKESDERKKKENLTLTYLENLIGGALAGDIDLEKIESSIYGLDLASLGMVEQTAEKLAPKPMSRALLVVDSSDTDKQEYLTRAAKLINFIPPLNLSFERFAVDPSDTSAVQTVKMWKTLGAMFNTATQKINALTVPQEFAAWHEEAVVTLARGSRLYDALGKLYEDPLLAMAALDTVPDFMERMGKMSGDLNALLEKHGSPYRVHAPLITYGSKKK